MVNIPVFYTYRLAFADFFVKFIIVAKSKGWRRGPADNMLLRKGENL